VGGAVVATGSRPVSVAMSLEELSLSPLVAASADSPVPVPPDVEPLAFSGGLHVRPPSPSYALTSGSASILSSPSSNPHSAAIAKRLSFVSYNDMLSSVPTATVSLSSVTHNAISEPAHTVVSIAPPPSENARIRTVAPPGTVGAIPRNASAARGGGSRASSRQSTLATNGGRSSAADVFSAPGGHGAVGEDGVGMGEWEREGFGTGLEERLEAALRMGSAVSITTPPAPALVVVPHPPTETV